MVRRPKAEYINKIKYSDKYKGVSWYFPGNKVDTAGSDKAMTINAAGIISNEPNFADSRNAVFRVSGSFFPSIFENVGKRTVCSGIIKKETSNVKFMARL